MLSESARATSAGESRFRIAAPNALPRSMMVVALDEGTAALAAGLADRVWRETSFFAVPPGPVPAAGQSFASWLKTITGQAIDLADEIGRVDMVQMLATLGQDTPAAALIGECALARGVKTSGVVIGDHGADPAALSRSLRALRPWVMTLSVIGSAGDVDEILHALGG